MGCGVISLFNIFQGGDGLFPIERLPTINLEFVPLWLQEYPQNSRILGNEEKVFVLRRPPSLAAPSGQNGDFDWASVKVLFSDRTLYTFGIY